MQQQGVGSGGSEEGYSGTVGADQQHQQQQQQLTHHMVPMTGRLTQPRLVMRGPMGEGGPMRLPGGAYGGPFVTRLHPPEGVHFVPMHRQPLPGMTVDMQVSGR